MLCLGDTNSQAKITTSFFEYSVTALSAPDLDDARRAVSSANRHSVNFFSHAFLQYLLNSFLSYLYLMVIPTPSLSSHVNTLGTLRILEKCLLHLPCWASVEVHTSPFSSPTTADLNGTRDLFSLSEYSEYISTQASHHAFLSLLLRLYVETIYLWLFSLLALLYFAQLSTSSYGSPF